MVALDFDTPTINVFSGAKVTMHADDHNPPHFHIVAPEFEVKVEIATMTVIAGKAPARRIGDAMAWAASNRAVLAVKWAELNQRG